MFQFENLRGMSRNACGATVAEKLGSTEPALLGCGSGYESSSAGAEHEASTTPKVRGRHKKIGRRDFKLPHHQNIVVLKPAFRANSVELSPRARITSRKNGCGKAATE